MIKVIGIKVRTSNKVYEPGDIISNMSPEDESALIKDGYAEKVEGTGEKTPVKDKVIIPTADELIKFIENTDKIEDIEKVLADEKAGKKRVTVLTAAEDKIRTLSANDEDTNEDGTGNEDGNGTNPEDPKDLVGNFNVGDTIITGAQK